MAKLDFKKFIIPAVLYNTSDTLNYGEHSFNTKDLVYLDSQREIAAYGDGFFERKTSLTDYAKYCGGLDHPDDNSITKNRKVTWLMLRSAYTETRYHIVDFDGGFNSAFIETGSAGICPALKLNVKDVILAQQTSKKQLFKIGEFNDPESHILYHTIEFGEFPKTKVSDELFDKLTDLHHSGKLHATGKKYTGYVEKGKAPVLNEEYIYNNEKYVRVQLVNKFNGNPFEGKYTYSNYGWVKVEPIIWKIRNWDELPYEINPLGSGLDFYIDVRTEEAILANFVFYPNSMDDYCYLWQNSTVRGYLNGINVCNIKTNGNPSCVAPYGGDFSDRQNFLREALELDSEYILNAKDDKKQKKIKKGYNITIKEEPMNVDQQIQFYIETGKSFMLHGPSGIGKTRRIEEADPDYVSIVLRNGILPEEIIGKTIYPNNDKTKGGIWVPPAWYVDLCQKCEAQPNKNHVLFIDEITNVKPSEQSLVFHLVLNNSIGPNVGKLPKNVVVVAAGNSKDESEAAYNMPEPLFRRFDGHIELQLDIQQWIEWGNVKVGDGNRLKIHPLVSAFVSAYADQAFYSSYDPENPPKSAIDPRGWEQVSDLIYDNNGVIARELIENKIGKEIAATFMAFAENPPLTLPDILEDNYEEDDIPTGFDAKYALALSLKWATEEQIEKIRNFVEFELGAEILAIFDLAWIGDNDERAIQIASLAEKSAKRDKNLEKEKVLENELPF